MLYKRGNFTEARMRLEQAIGPAALPDPVVLDHYGDILYRQGNDKAAAAQWKRALDGIDPNADRPDLKDLKLELQNKLQELQSQEPVHVAPIVGSPEKPV
jgi:Tfp pilus assembly protein PilF